MQSLFDNYYSGTSGLLLPVPNKQFYPEAFKEKSRLCYYASLMNSIEINSSFYKVPQASTLVKWAGEVPDNFRFTFKLFKGITHHRDLAFDDAMVANFMKVISVVAKKGCLLVQFPPSVRMAQFQQLQRLMGVLRSNDPLMDWKIAFEFRHLSLTNDEVDEQLENYHIARVIHDKIPGNLNIQTPTDFNFIRFHGPFGDYRGGYSDEVLQEYATYITEWLVDHKKVFVYFNNTLGGALANLNTLRQMVKNSF